MALWKRGRRYWTQISVNGVRMRRPLCPPGSTRATTNWQEAVRLEKELIRAALRGRACRPQRRPSSCSQPSTTTSRRRRRLRTRSGRSNSTASGWRVVKRHLGDVKLSAITARVIEGFQAKRRLEGAGNRTINMDVGALRQVLRRFKQWRRLEDDVKMLTEAGGAPVGRVLTTEEQERLLRGGRGQSGMGARLLRCAARGEHVNARRRSEARATERFRSRRETRSSTFAQARTRRASASSR